MYVLWSNKLQKCYFGYTNDLKRRLSQHNSGDGAYTTTGKPWKLVYYEAYVSDKDAKKRERNLKKRPNTVTFLKQRLQESLNVVGERPLEDYQVDRREVYVL